MSSRWTNAENYPCKVEQPERFQINILDDKINILKMKKEVNDLLGGIFSLGEENESADRINGNEEHENVKENEEVNEKLEEILEIISNEESGDENREDETNEENSDDTNSQNKTNERHKIKDAEVKIHSGENGKSEGIKQLSEKLKEVQKCLTSAENREEVRENNSDDLEENEKRTNGKSKDPQFVSNSENNEKIKKIYISEKLNDNFENGKVFKENVDEIEGVKEKLEEILESISKEERKQENRAEIKNEGNLIYKNHKRNSDGEINETVARILEELVQNIGKGVTQESRTSGLGSDNIDEPVEDSSRMTDEDVVKKLLADLLDEIVKKKKTKKSKKKSLTTGASVDGNKENTPEVECVHHPKGILKHGPCLCEKHVGFAPSEPEFIRPYDESKDYTVEIQIVEKLPKKVVSYKQLFADQKKADQAAEKAANQDR